MYPLDVSINLEICTVVEILYPVVAGHILTDLDDVILPAFPVLDSLESLGEILVKEFRSDEDWLDGVIIHKSEDTGSRMLPVKV